MSETNAENRDLAAELLYNVDDNSRVLGTSGTRRENDPVGVECADFLNRQLVVADNPDIRLKLADVLIEIV